MFARPLIDEGDIVALIGIGPIGKVVKISGRFAITDRGVYPKISLLLLRKKVCGCGKKH